MWRPLQGRGSQSAALFKDVEWRNAASCAKQFGETWVLHEYAVRIHRRNPSMSPWIRRRVFHRTKIMQRSRLYEFRFRTQRFAIRDIIHLIYATQIFWHLRKAFDFYRHRIVTRCTSLYKKTDVESKNISANIVINVSTLMVFSTDKLCKSRIKYSICVLGNIHYRAKVWDH